MEGLLPLLLAALVSAEELRFLPVFEQSAEASCGAAAAASLLSLYCGRPREEAELAAALPQPGGASLRELLALIRGEGIGAAAFRLGPGELGEALDRGLAPALLHYDRPRGHFALLLGREGGIFVAADPARGLESLGLRELEARWSGGTILLDPASLSAGGRELREEALEAALGRRALAERAPRGEEEGPAPRGRRAERERVGSGLGGARMRLGLDLELEAPGQGLGIGAGLGLELRSAGGLGLGLLLPFEAWLGDGSASVLPGDLGLELGLARPAGAWILGARLGLGLPTAAALEEGRIVPAGCLGFSAGLSLARIMDPASLGASLGAGLLLPGRGEAPGSRPSLSLGLGLSIAEALNDRVFLSASGSLGAEWEGGLGEARTRVELSALAGLSLGGFGASLGSSSRSDLPERRPLRLGLSWERGGAP